MGRVQRFFERRYEDKYARMSPEERAAEDEKLARVHARAQEQIDAAHQRAADADETNRRIAAEGDALRDHVLGGPAGQALYGGGVQMSAMDQLKHTARAFTDVKNVLGVGSGYTDGPTDPRERARIQVAERAARDVARQPYRAPQPSPVTITRIPCRGSTQHGAVVGFLTESGLAARPDLVFGLYRVPDRISPRTPGGEGGRYVEWDVVHSPVHHPAPAPHPQAAPPRVARFEADRQWARRSYGEPSVLDEDLALAWLCAAGVPPEACFGIARDVVIEAGTEWQRMGGAQTDAVARVTGVSAFHTAPHQPDGQVNVPLDGVAGTHVEVMNWGAVRRAVHPRPQKGPETPSPFPYLPSTPQELLLAYLDVVGLRPQDCYGAEVTIDETTAYGPKTSTDGESLSADDLRGGGYLEFGCADGKPRTRLHGGTLVVLSYRDRPEYAEGRERWRAYQRDVLFAELQRKTGARRPIADEFEDVPGGGVIRAVSRVAGLLDKVTLSNSEPDSAALNLRYCQPLAPK